MTVSHHASGDAAPRHVLPIRGSRALSGFDDLLSAVVAEIASDRRKRRLLPVEIAIDVGPCHEPVADPALIRETLAPLVAAACEAAAAPAPASDSPRVREVLVTVVETSRGVEIEIADSGPGPEVLPAESLRVAQTRAERLGGGLVVASCPDGGAAVTLCLPRRHEEQSQLIRPAA